MREEIFGGLRVRITGGLDREGGGHGPAVVLLHGFGAAGDDLVPLWRVLDVPREVRFVFPEAPLPLALGFGDARAWWMIDLERLERLQRGGVTFGDRAREVPAGMAEASAMVAALLDEVEARLAVPPGKLVLGGFSQGAMLSCDVALRGPRRLAGLVLMSGTLLAEHEWQPRMAAHQGLRVLMSHGDADPLLPLAASVRLRDLFVAAGLEVRFLPFPGQHEIPGRVLDELSVFLGETLAG